MAQISISSTVLADKSFAVGTDETTTIVVPDAATGAVLRVDRTALPISASKWCIKAQIWISYDGGRKFDLLVGFTTNGGIIKDGGGNVLTESYASRGIKPKYKTNDRIIKVITECRNPLSTKLTLDLT